jgi:hypothetical protein
MRRQLERERIAAEKLERRKREDQILCVIVWIIFIVFVGVTGILLTLNGCNPGSPISCKTYQSVQGKVVALTCSEDSAPRSKHLQLECDTYFNFQDIHHQNKTCRIESGSSKSDSSASYPYFQLNSTYEIMYKEGARWCQTHQVSYDIWAAGLFMLTLCGFRTLLLLIYTKRMPFVCIQTDIDVITICWQQLSWRQFENVSSFVCRNVTIKVWYYQNDSQITDFILIYITKTILNTISANFKRSSRS